MTDLNIPNFRLNSNKYIFKKKLSLRRKSKKRLFIESAFMFILGLFLVYINFLIPNKILLIQNFPADLNRSFSLLIELFSNLYGIFLLVFMFISYLLVFILLIGSLYRIVRITKRKTRIINYK